MRLMPPVSTSVEPLSQSPHFLCPPSDHFCVPTVLHPARLYILPTHQVAYIPKYCAEDTTLPCTTAQGEKIRIPVPRGTYLGLVTSGLHNNRTWLAGHFEL